MTVSPEFESDAENCVACAEERGRGMFEATYDPQDDKLRLRASRRLDAETYEKAKALGFRWAPKQDLFFATWSPSREDFLEELAGEIDDEDTTLVERAEARAERFEEYSEKRADEAEAARKAVDAIADNIPLGQPILVGHHSERRARKDAERIENGMRRAIKMWDTSKYWTSRAAGALRAAKYKELPTIRHRRIKTLESEKRKVEKTKRESEMWLKAWSIKDLTQEQAVKIANVCWLHLPRKEGDREDFSHSPTAYDALNNSHPTLYAPRTLDEVVEHAKAVYPRSIAHCDRWIAHYENRLAYERAMLDEQIGTGELGSGMGGRFDIKPGGKVLVRDGWATVLRVNKAGGVINSVTCTAPAGVHWQNWWKYGIEKVKDYQPPSAEAAAAAKKATKLPPITNYPTEGCLEMTDAEWRALMKRKWSDFPYYGFVAATSTAGKHRVRQKPGPSLSKVRVFITDAKRVDPPKPESIPRLAPNDPPQAASSDKRCPDCGWELPRLDCPHERCNGVAAHTKVTQEKSFEVTADALEAALGADAVVEVPTAVADLDGISGQDRDSYSDTQDRDGYSVDESEDAIEAMRASLKAGVKIVAAPQLFPTPPEVARRAVEMAGIERCDLVLEPSAGTGNLIDAIKAAADGTVGITAIERNVALAEGLRRRFDDVDVVCADFLDVEPTGRYHRVVMNPPFGHGADVKHVERALEHLRPGGRLVAIIGGGPRQEKAFKHRAAEWQELPSGTFAGTGVRAILMAIDKEQQ